MALNPIVITPPAYDPIVAYGIGGLALAVAVLWIWIFARGNPRLALLLTVCVGALLGGSALAARSGVLVRFDRPPPPMLLLLASVIAIATCAGLSRFGRAAAVEVPLVVLIGLQSFRLPLELVMHRAAERGIMPVQLSYSGFNFDIVTGAGAVLLAVWLASGAKVPRTALWAWNVWGLYCLAAIAVIAISTLPNVRAFGDDASSVNSWVLFFPYVWLPAVLVPAALFGHIVITRPLLSESPPPKTAQHREM